MTEPALEATAIRVLLIDDHLLFNDGVGLLVDREPDLRVVGTFGTAEEALARMVELTPDVALVDINLPGMNGIEATRRITTLHPGTKVVILSSTMGVDDLVAAFDAGAVGYVPKSHAPEYLMVSIRAAFRGEAIIPGDFVRPVMAALQARHAKPDRPGYDGSGLTPREREVLQALVQGKSVRDIATGLHLTVFTVRGHVRGILKKLGVSSMAQAVAFAIRGGLV